MICIFDPSRVILGIRQEMSSHAEHVELFYLLRSPFINNQKHEIIYMTPGELQKVIEEAINLPPNVKKRFVEIVGRYQPKN
jgi:hypothetical protein